MPALAMTLTLKPFGLMFDPLERQYRVTVTNVDEAGRGRAQHAAAPGERADNRDADGCGR